MESQSILKIYYFRIKNWIIVNESAVVVATGVLLVAAISFGLGALWQDSYNKKAPIIVNNQKSAFAGVIEQQDTILDGGQILITKEGDNMAKEAVYVASKNGTSYHLPSCPGAKQIKPENKIEFISKEEAEKAGYKPAANCPGLK